LKQPASPGHAVSCGEGQRVCRPAFKSQPHAQAGAARDVEALRLDIVSTRVGFEALAGDWTDLHARAGTSAQVFQAYGWCHHWVRSFVDESGGGGSLAILTGRIDGRLVMLWPLVLRRVAGLKELSWLGEPVSQYGDVLMEPGPDQARQLDAGFRYIVDVLRPSLFRLNKTRTDANIAPLLAKLGARETQRLEAPYLDFTTAPDWQSYETRYGSKALKNRRRQFRRLEEAGPVAVTHHNAGSEAQRLACEAIRLKRAWLSEKGLISPALADDGTLRFFESITGDPAQSESVRVSHLTAGGRTAAISVSFACKERLAVHLIVYASAFEKAAAGALLLERSMKAAHEEGIKVYDMLAPGGGYKTEWADASAQVVDFCVPLTAAGYGYGWLYLEVLRPKLKDAAFALEGAKRRFRRTRTPAT